MDDVNDAWIDDFNDAAELARELEHGRALHRYLRVIAAAGHDAARGERLRFVVTAQVRAAFCAMDLGRYGQARRLLQEARAHEDALEDDDRFELHFALANTLANLGDVAGMDASFACALAIAAELDDDHLAARCRDQLARHRERLTMQ